MCVPCFVAFTLYYAGILYEDQQVTIEVCVYDVNVVSMCIY